MEAFVSGFFTLLPGVSWAATLSTRFSLLEVSGVALPVAGMIATSEVFVGVRRLEALEFRFFLPELLGTRELFTELSCFWRSDVAST